MTATASSEVDVAGRRGARVALLGFLALSSVFVVSSAWQLARAVFFDGSAGVRSHELDRDGACGRALRTLAVAVDEGLARTASVTDEGSTLARFDATVDPAWRTATDSGAIAACDDVPGGPDARAAVERLRSVARSASGRRAASVAGARLDVTHILGP